ncbi:MAG: shikimate dehydrogenase [Porticoccus sp.]|nr:shikimate dehydrogenase [Porticoccus sp.]
MDNYAVPDSYAVFGNPIEHSKSPAIHAAFAAATGEDIIYQKQQVDVGGFSEAADVFFSAGGKGLNITVPFKQDAYSYAAKLTARARHAGAVNTLSLQDDGTVLGDTTDGVGMVRDMVDNLGWKIKGKKVLVLGAGGAVRGVLEPLLELLPQHVVIANRTIDKALQLSKGFAEMGYLLGCGFDMLPGQQFDLVVNGTSASLAGELPPLPEGLLTEHAYGYDMMYGPEPTVFMRWAQQHGAVAVADGLGMLVEQAAESFCIWRGVKPDTKSVIIDLRSGL